MKLKIERNILLKSLSHFKNVVEKKNTIPILSNIKLEAEGNMLNIIGTDLDIDLSEKIECDIQEQGVTTVSAHILYDIVKKLPSEENILLHLENDKFIVKQGKSKFNLAVLRLEDFPVFEDSKYDITFDVESKDLQKLLSKVQFAISNEETRYYLQGVYFHINEDKNICAVATDGHRLAKSEINNDNNIQFEGVIIPKKTVSEMLGILPDCKTITISVSKNKIKFSYNNINLSSKLIDGIYPDYTRVIPKSNNKILQVQTSSIISSIDMVTSVASDGVKSVKLKLEKDSLSITSFSSQKGSAIDVLDVAYDNEDLEIGFNAKYLIEALSRAICDTVEILFNDYISPVIIKDVKNKDVLYVVMPMRV